MAASQSIVNTLAHMFERIMISIVISPIDPSGLGKKFAIRHSLRSSLYRYINIAQAGRKRVLRGRSDIVPQRQYTLLLLLSHGRLSSLSVWCKVSAPLSRNLHSSSGFHVNTRSRPVGA